MSALSNKQRLFSEMVGELLRWIYANGYAVTFGDAYRDPRVFGGIGKKLGYGRSKSLHKQRLAIDLNLFKEIDGNWMYMDKSEDHRPVGEYWESLGGSWGGRFDDGNHYSLAHEGRR